VGFQLLELGTTLVRSERPVATSPDARPAAPLVRASRAWTALKVSPVLESLAFLARGMERGQPPRAAACAEHVLGPLVGAIIGPVGGLLPQDSVEELFQRAAVERRVTTQEWLQWRRARFTAHLLEDVTMLAHRGSCLTRSDVVLCTCGGDRGEGDAVAADRSMRLPGQDLGPVPALTPDPTGRSDPWEETLVLLASTFRGRGSPLSASCSGSRPPAIRDMRILGAHVDRLAGAFAGPRRTDRMSGLERVEWHPALRITQAWRMRDVAGGTERARMELLERLRFAVGL
jgi:hypothetical protein